MPSLEPLEQRRRRILMAFRYVFIVLLAFLSAHLTVIILFKQPWYHFLLSSAATTVLTVKLYQWIFTDKSLGINFKDALFKAMLPVMLPVPPMFDPARHVAFKYFAESRLFLYFPSSFGGANAVKGGTLEASFLYSELEAYIKTGKEEIPVFDGMFYVFSAYGEYNPPIVIVPNRLQKLGLIGKKIGQHAMFRGRAAKMFDETFENEFSVYAENTLLAQQTVTKEIRKQLLDFRAQTDADIYMSFVGRKIYVGLHNCPPVRFSVHKSCMDLSYIEEMAAKFTFPIRLVSEINQKLIPPKAPPNWDI